jgi:hypothetical protein
MRASCLLVAAVVLAAAGVARGQCDDPFDAVLCVNTITPMQEATFSSTDGTVSTFWAGLTGDYFELVPPDDCYPGMCNFSGTSDGTITVKAAGTGRGVYLYVEVQDNVWVDWSGGASYGDDSVDLYFDKLDANTVYTCTDCLIGLYDSRLSYTTQQFQVFMGASTPPSTFRFQSYDANMWSWTTVDLSWADAKAQYGFEMEVVTVDATHKVQEWFFPWQKYGTGYPVGENMGGKLLAFAGGYNDMDGDNPDPDKLRWPLGGDPWGGDQNYWGDVQLASDIGTVQEVVTSAVRGPALGAGIGVPEGGLAEYYTLRGERVPSRAVVGAASGIVVQRAAQGAAARCVGVGR